MSLWMVALLSSLLAAAGTGVVRRYALARSVLDVPNARSAHSVPVPRGGGMAIVLAVLAAIAVAWLSEGLGRAEAIALGGGTLLTAAVGWYDDHHGVRARWRAACHLAAGAWAVAWLGGLPTLQLGSTTLRLGPLGSLLAVLGIAWAVNLYNFMDGIDGLAASEAVLCGSAGGALLLLAGRPAMGAVALAAAAASLGFLLWNWAPARIFMGDVGSGALGYLFAVLALASERAGALPLLGWVVLLGVFVFDATVTLVRRLLRREPVHEAHCSHAYQRAVRAGMSHPRVVLGVAGVNAVLALAAAAMLLRPRWLPALCLLAALLLALAYLWVERRNPMYPRPVAAEG